MKTDPNEIIRQLVESWCARLEYRPLAIVLPSWIANTGMTDGWSELHDALKLARAMCVDLPEQERTALQQAYVAIEIALRKPA